MNCKKIAVILRGHKRTWEWTKKSIFEFFDDKADTVDYYVSWWQTGIFIDSIRNDFIDKNLKCLILADYKEQYGDPFYGPAYLSNLAANHIFEEEVLSGTKYDLVVDTRPDVFHHDYSLNKIKWHCPPWSLGFVRIDTDQNGIRGLDDHCFIGRSETISLWNQRIFMNMNLADKLNLPNGHHSLYNTFVDNYYLHKFQIPWFHSVIVRPAIVRYGKQLSIEKVNAADRIWQQSKIAVRTEWVTQANIPDNEYDSSLGKGPLPYITE